MPRTDTAELGPYLRASWQLIPLHSWDYFDERGGKRRERGKSPLHSNWTRKPYKSEEQVAHLESGGNVGVRLRAGDLVIDVDPRNFKEGDDPFKRLCADCALDPSAYPTVETGSGGLHVYMSKPDDVSVRDSLPDYEGVEFKTIGRQVVAAGSVHPSTQRTYVWDFLSPALTDPAPLAPDRLVNLIRRPTRVTGAVGGGGEHTQEELATMLEALAPEDFRDHGAWLTLMQACHHSTAGAGRQEFVEWSTRDPGYADHAGIIGRRWDSLHADGGARVTYRTLHKLLMDAGAEAAIPRRPAEDDFESVGPEDAPTGPDEAEHEQRGPLERMNDRYWAVMEGSKFKVYWEESDPDTAIPDKGVKARSHWIKAQVWDFKLMLMNRRVQRGEKTVPMAEAWLEWGGRRSARGVTFDPEHDHEGFLNLWTGWGYDPRKGGCWGRLEELLHDVLCDGDDRVFKYVMDWAAHLVQHPGRPAEVALCFQGGRGTGKGTWGRALAGLAGKHGMQVTSSDQLTGRFNDHLRDVIVLFADEAIKPYDKEAESRLKALITEPRLAYEGKGKDIKTAENRLHIVMASNDDWFVPVGLEGERRFLLQRTNTRRVGQHSWFGRLHAELESGGYEGLLWDLMHRDIGDWAPRQDIPTTLALVEQKLRNMGPMQQWWFNVLHEGAIPFPVLPEGADWTERGVRVFKEDVRDSFADHCKAKGIRSSGASGRGIDMMFTSELATLVPRLRSKTKMPVPDDRPDVRQLGDGRAWTYEFPPLNECQKSMEALLGLPLDWGTDE